MPSNYQENSSELCQAGKLLKLEFTVGINGLEKSAQRMEASCAVIAASVKQLTEYNIRDKERIDALEKSRDCKSQKIKDIQENMHNLEVSFGTHLGEYAEMKRQEGNVGRKWGVLSGLGGAGGFWGIIEILKRMLSSG